MGGRARRLPRRPGRRSRRAARTALTVPENRSREPGVSPPPTAQRRRHVRTPMLIGGAVLVGAVTAAIASAAGSLPNIGTPTMTPQPVYRGYYDHHIDTYLITDVSSKLQARAMHVN